ncbi:MAG: GntR family transcriptional regulator [Pseudomonadota bacterium]|nr:GntR family transcriptional regulator [Pseudomonadota bacterium]
MSSLHVLLAHRVLDHIRAERLPAGHHLTEQSLEGVLGTSRSPIRGALAHLTERGVLMARPPRRGLFLVRDGTTLDVPESEEATEERGYLALARDRLAGELPVILTEKAAMARYGLTRERVRRILGRAAQEGWIEPRASKGWSFLPMIDGPEAYAESYALRAMLEPAALMMPKFRADPAVIQRLQGQQFALADGGYRTAGRVELFQANATFHEALAGLSGNRFITQVIARQNQLRRLLEYRLSSDDRARVGRQCEEHLAILSLIEHGKRAEAAQLLGEHLRNAGVDKVRQLETTMHQEHTP